MKFKIILPLAICLLCLGMTVQAQENNQDEVKKATLVIKTVDENGVETTETIELEGDEIDQHFDANPDAERRIKVIKTDGEDPQIWINEDGESINLMDNDFEFHSEGDGEHEVRILKFSPNSEIDIENGENVDVEVIEENGEKIITVKVDGEEKVIRVKADGEEGQKMKKRIIMFDGDDAHGEHEIHVVHDGHEMSLENKPFLGIEIREEVEVVDEGNGEVTTNSNENGIVVDGVIPNSGAEAAGLQEGDIIKKMDGTNMGGFDDLKTFMRTKNVGDQVTLDILRDDTNMQVVLTLGERSATPRFKHFDREKRIMKEHRDHHRMSKRMHVKRDPCKPFIGFYNEKRSNNTQGVMVTRIIPNTPAERHGLQEGDIVLEMDGIAFRDYNHLIEIRDAHDAGDRFKLLIERDGKRQKVKGYFNDCPKDNVVQSIPELDNAVEIDGQVNTSFQAFPNPSKGNVTVAYEGLPGSINLKVSDITGKVILDKTIDNFDGAYQEEFDFSQAAEGALIIQIENGDEVLVEKLILQNKN